MKGIVGFIGASIQENPGMAAGFVAFVVAFFLVSGNALYGQRGKHPGPLWATRDNMVTKAIEKNPERNQGLAPRREMFESFVQAPQVVPIPTHRARVSAAAVSQTDLVRDIQSELAAAGYYSKDIDGRFGPNTQQAIRKYQAASGVAVNGLASADLLSSLHRRSMVALDARIEKVVARSARNDDDSAVPQKAAERQGQLAEAGISLAEVTRAAMIARIQIGLINFGETGVVPDGQLGEDTAAAIRQFQKRYDLPVTGEPEAAVIEKLESLGLLQRI